MRLSKDADSYYRLVLGQRISSIESWFQPEMNRVQSFTARGGAKNQRIADVIIERWRRLVDTRVECLLEAYKLHAEVIDETDVEEFFNDLMAGFPRVQASVGHYAGVSGASRYLSNHLEPINRSARSKLYVEVRRAQLERQPGKERGKPPMYRPRFARENDFLTELDRQGIDIRVDTQPGVAGRQYRAKALRVNDDAFLVSKAHPIARGYQLQYLEGTDWWEVIDKEEEWSGSNAMIGYLVTVERVGEDRKRIEKRNESGVVIHGPVTGGIQVGGTHNVQTVTVNQQFNESFNRLREAIDGSPELTSYQKEDAIEALNKLPALADAGMSEDVTGRAKDKLEMVKSVISIGKDLAIVAMPYLEALARHWS